MKHFVKLSGGTLYQLEKEVYHYRRGETSFIIDEALEVTRNQKVKDLRFTVAMIVASWSEEPSAEEKKQKEVEEKEAKWNLIFEELKKKALEAAQKEIEEKEKNKGILDDFIKRHKPVPPFNPINPYPYPAPPWRTKPYPYPTWKWDKQYSNTTTIGKTFNITNINEELNKNQEK